MPQCEELRSDALMSESATATKRSVLGGCSRVLTGCAQAASSSRSKMVRFTIRRRLIQALNTSAAPERVSGFRTLGKYARSGIEQDRRPGKMVARLFMPDRAYLPKVRNPDTLSTARQQVQSFAGS